MNWSASAGRLKPAWPRSGRSMKWRKKESTDHLRIGVTRGGTSQARGQMVRSRKADSSPYKKEGGAKVAHKH